jgi:two-component sensor histidine kinase
MKKHSLKSLLFLFFTISLVSVYANQKSKNSLRVEMQEAKNLVDSMNLYFEIDQDKYKRFLADFNNIDFDILVDSNFREVILFRADFFQRNYKYREAIPILFNSINIAANRKDTLSMATFHKMMSSLYYYLGNQDSTNYQLEQAYSYYKYLDNKAELGIISIRQARMEYDLGNYEKAILLSFQALELNKAAGDQQKMAISYLQLGNTYYFLTNYRDSKKYFELASMLFKKSEYDYGYYEVLSNIGLVEIREKQYRKGISKQFAALKFWKKENYAIDAGVTYNFLVTAYLELQNYDSASYYNGLAKKEFQKSSFKTGFCESYLNDAKIYFAKGKFNEALISAQEGYAIAIEYSFNELLEEANFQLYKIHKKLNNNSESFEHLEEYVKLKDSLNFNPNSLQSDAMKYQLAAEEAQLKQQFAEERALIQAEEGAKTKQQLDITLIIVMITLILLVVSIHYLLKNRKLNKSLSIQRMRITEQLKVKESLLSEIHHRVKNNLQVISSMLGLQNHYITDESLKKIIMDCKGRITSMSLIHESLYRKQDFREALFSSYIEDLLPRLIQTYCADEGKIHLEMDIEPIKLSLDDSLPCGLILNEIISNSLKHGFPDGREGKIRIEFKQVHKIVYLTISDNGVGLEEGKSFIGDESFGFLLIDTLASQLNAEIMINTSNGFTYELKWENKIDAIV